MAQEKASDTSALGEDRRRWIAELRKFSVCQLADALGPSCPIETGVRPIDTRFRICGPAFTVQCLTDDNLTVHHALHLAQPGDVLVVGGSPDSKAALWGELMSMCARARGLEGTVIDGTVRDPVEIQDLKYPVFCREFSPRRAAKDVYGRIHGRLQIGNICVNPGDIVLADANGIICLTPEQVGTAIERTSEVAQREGYIKDQIRSGRTTFEILELKSP